MFGGQVMNWRKYDAEIADDLFGEHAFKQRPILHKRVDEYLDSLMRIEWENACAKWRNATKRQQNVMVSLNERWNGECLFFSPSAA